MKNEENPNFPKDVFNALDSATRKKILRFLYNSNERSSYSIKNDLNLNISISTVIEHLRKLEKAGLITSKEANKGKLIRYHHKITDKGKKYLREYYISEFEDIKEIPEIATNLFPK